MGLHVRPCLLLKAVQEQFFPNTEVVLVDLASGEEAKMNDVMDLMVLAIPTGNQVEFIAKLDEGAFEEFRTIIFLLSYTNPRDDPCLTNFSECNGQPQLLIEKLRKDLNTEGRDVIFSDTLPPETSVAVHTIEKVFSNPILDFGQQTEPSDLSVRAVPRMPINIPDEVHKRLWSMVEAVTRARVSKDTSQVEARFQDLRAYCDEQMHVRKSVVFPLMLARACSDVDQEIGFFDQALAVSRQTEEEIHCALLFMLGTQLLGDERLDDARKWLVEARDRATASGVEIFATTANQLLDDISRIHPSYTTWEKSVSCNL